MSFCVNCGCQNDGTVKFCTQCGTPAAASSNTVDNMAVRQTTYVSELHKCPNCGEVLESFVSHCPSCGMELRAVKATSSVREFASKLEQIEAGREYEKPRGLFSTTA